VPDVLDADALATALRAAGRRVTTPRLAVYAAVAAHGHLDADGVGRAVRGELGSVSTQTFYDALGVLCELELLRRIEPAHSPALYETRVADNHHHVICRGCGAVADVDCAVGDAPCLEPSSARGFVVDEAEVTYWGLCPACQPTPGGAS
jgi:Fur family transcriptional regulator, stress-responsive regulator